MLNNYNYFITLAEEQNLSKAAERLFISHQALSRYLKTLEQHYHVTFFHRNPRLKITPAGEVYLDMLRQIQRLEQNFEHQLDDIRSSLSGRITIGVPEGRNRLLIPELLPRFKAIYPDVDVQVISTTTHTLCDMVQNNDLDLAMINQNDLTPSMFNSILLLNEQLFLVISDDLLEQYFPDQYPKCLQTFQRGVNLADFQAVPFVLNKKGFNSRTAIDAYLTEHSLSLNCVMEMTQTDIHFMLSARDYAASFCWSLFAPLVEDLNTNPVNSHLNVFPITGLNTRNPFVLIHAKGRIFPSYTRELIRMTKSLCCSGMKSIDQR